MAIGITEMLPFYVLTFMQTHAEALNAESVEYGKRIVERIPQKSVNTRRRRTVDASLLLFLSLRIGFFGYLIAPFIYRNMCVGII